VGRGDRVVRVERAVLEGQRPLPLGRNARLPSHGAVVRVPLCRLTTSDGLVGVGPSKIDIEAAYGALGLEVCQTFGQEGTEDRWRSLDYPLWDLAARSQGVAVYQLLGGERAQGTGTDVPLTVNCYDTSLYFEEPRAARNEPLEVARRAAASYERGHRAFKVKVGRGARWMEPEDGLNCDVAVMQAVRDAIGPTCELLADANNGFTFNGTRRFLARTADARVGWLEEPFNEDAVLLRALKEWMAHEGLAVSLADCETASPDDAYRFGSDGLLDVIQCDILQAGFTAWLKLGRALDCIGVDSAPHHFGLFLGNYLSGHLAGAVKCFKYVEWDEATVPGIFMSGYHFGEGRLTLEGTPGFGVELDEELFGRAVASTGFDLRIERT
jgi:L-rhamnonate dehydratase